MASKSNLIVRVTEYHVGYIRNGSMFMYTISSEWWRTDQELPFVRSGVISSEESKLQNTQTTENVKVHKTATAIRARIRGSTRGSTNVMTVTLILR